MPAEMSELVITGPKETGALLAVAPPLLPSFSFALLLLRAVYTYCLNRFANRFTLN